MKQEKIVDDIIAAFEESGLKVEANRLRGFINNLDSDSLSIRQCAADEIISFCHPKAWGDLAVANNSSRYRSVHDWDMALAELIRYAKKSKGRSCQ